MLIRRTRRPTARQGFTDIAGFKTADAPAYWPFGRKHPMTTKAQPRVKRKRDEDEFGT